MQKINQSTLCVFSHVILRTIPITVFNKKKKTWLSLRLFFNRSIFLKTESHPVCSYKRGYIGLILFTGIQEQKEA